MKLIFSWLLVIIPLAWGVSMSVTKAKPLFQEQPAAIVSPKPAP